MIPTSLSCSVIAILLIAGCAAQSTLQHNPNSDQSTSVEKINQNFKIHSFTVKWIDNPEFKINLERTMPTFLTALVLTSFEVRGVWHPGQYQPISSNIPEDSKKMADAYIGEILRLQKENSAGFLKSALNAKGIQEGDEMVITITPLSGFQSIDGWGTNVLFRTEFMNPRNSQSAFVDTMLKSGIHWTGVANASKPTIAYVQQYIDSLSDTLRSANAF